jgi:dTDP-4-dehydrorhamnose 3,5-epimerase
MNTNIKDCYLRTPKLFEDNRGIFSELYKMSLSNFICKQVNYSMSKSGTLRGMHEAPYAKIVACIAGEILDVCVDTRADSPTFMQHFAIKLNPQSMQQLYIPSNCAHGFYSYTDSLVIYLQDGEYDKNKDIAHCYKKFNIEWPTTPTIISAKDNAACL